MVRTVGVVAVNDLLLVERTSSGLVRGDEASANPHTAASHSQRRSQSPAIEDASGTDDKDGTARQRRPAAAAGVHHLRQEDRCRHIASVAATLAALGADDVHA